MKEKTWAKCVDPCKERGETEGQKDKQEEEKWERNQAGSKGANQQSSLILSFLIDLTNQSGVTIIIATMF